MRMPFVDDAGSQIFGGVFPLSASLNQKTSDAPNSATATCAFDFFGGGRIQDGLIASGAEAAAPYCVAICTPYPDDAIE